MWTPAIMTGLLLLVAISPVACSPRVCMCVSGVCMRDGVSQCQREWEWVWGGAGGEGSMQGLPRVWR